MTKRLYLLLSATYVCDLQTVIGKVDVKTLGKVMGYSVRFIEQHYDTARVENMMDYIT